MKGQHEGAMHSVISLFSGIGGLDRGLHDEGFQPIYCAEKDPNARSTLREWLRRESLSPIIAEDVTEEDPQHLRRQLGLNPGEVALLAGGPPCQSFSLIGKKLALGDHRGLLVFEMARFAEAFQPQAILMEQVKGLRSAKGPDGKKGGVLRLVIREFVDLGYKVSWKVLRAADFGVPQLRDRLFVIATKGRTFQFPEPTHIDPTKQRRYGQTLFDLELSPYRTAEQAIRDLPPPVTKNEDPPLPNHIDVTTSRDRERIREVPEGSYLAKQTHLSRDLRGRLDPKKDTTKFRRLAWGLPSLTIRGGEAFYHPVADRYLTPRECMRLHGFPDDHVLIGPIRSRSGRVANLDQHRLVGNAVPPPLARILAAELKAQGFVGQTLCIKEATA